MVTGKNGLLVSIWRSSILEISWKFRETNALKAFYSKMALEMAVFCIFGANLRKFDLFGLLEEGLDYQNL